MKYEVGEIVYIQKCSKLKRIYDSEIIYGVEMYYMSDNTSYSSNELSRTYCEENLEKKIEKNLSKIKTLIDFKKTSNNWINYFNNNHNN